jgi:hypothetical protein
VRFLGSPNERERGEQATITEPIVGGLSRRIRRPGVTRRAANWRGVQNCSQIGARALLSDRLPVPR